MNTADTRQLVAKLWNYCDVLRDDGAPRSITSNSSPTYCS